MDDEKDAMDLKVTLIAIVIAVLAIFFTVRLAQMKNPLVPEVKKSEFRITLDKSLEQLETTPTLEERFLGRESEHFKPLLDVILKNYVPKYTTPEKIIGITHTKGIVFIASEGEIENDYEIVTLMSGLQDWIKAEDEKTKQK